MKWRKLITGDEQQKNKKQFLYPLQLDKNIKLPTVMLQIQLSFLRNIYSIYFYLFLFEIKEWTSAMLQSHWNILPLQWSFDGLLKGSLGAV